MIKSTKVVTVVLPCFNEGSRIKPIISALKKSEYVSQIIVVDDGSNPVTKSVLASLTGITLVTHSHNLGKSQALYSGFSQVVTPLVAFIDSDLKNFTTAKFNFLAKPVIEGKFHMTIGARKRPPLHTALSGFEIACSGQRVLAANILNNQPQVFDQLSYLFEARLNSVFQRRFSSLVVIYSDLNQFSKMDKNGLRGLLGEFKMLSQIVNGIGLSTFISQLIWAKSLPRLEFSGR